MRAIHVVNHGSADELKVVDLPKPIPGPDEVLIKVKYAGVNFIDVYMRRGDPMIPMPTPFIPGVEGSGIVEAVGKHVIDIKPHDQVVFLSSMGSYAEYAVTASSKVAILPKELSLQEGAALMLQGLTAQYLVNDCTAIKQGDHVFVYAAAGGVGLMVTQLLKLAQANVIAAVSSLEKKHVVQAAGADYVVNYQDANCVNDILKYTSYHGVEYIIDGIGSMFENHLKLCKVKGVIALFGHAGGAALPISPHVLQPKSLTLVGGNLMNYIQTREELQKRFDALAKVVQDGFLRLHIDHIFSLENASLAHQLIESRKNIGKILISI